MAGHFSHMVLAGHPMFEPKIGYARSSIFSGNNILHPELTSNGTSESILPQESPFDSHLNRRWVGAGVYTDLWPNRKIWYCFKDEAAREALEEDVESAFEIWYAAGLGANDFSHEQLDDCIDNNEVYVLVISYSLPKSQGGTGTLFSTVACPNEYDRFFRMTLSDDTTVGSLDVVANYVHELGHAWGLYHEHQNPYLWADEDDGGEGGTLFTLANFHCQNLADYDTSLARANAIIDDPTTSADDVAKYTIIRDGMCTNRTLAANLGFGGKEWLPLSRADGIKAGSTVRDTIDWDSVMMYPSGAGGATLPSGERAPVLTKANGDVITGNLRPSTQDLKAIIELYSSEDDSDDDIDETLLNDPTSGLSDTFAKVRVNDIGTATASAC